MGAGSADDPKLHAATPEDVLGGRTVPAEARATVDVLRAVGEDPEVACELRLDRLPLSWPWAVLCGVEESVAALEGREVEVLAVPEGTVVYPEEPVLQVIGRYEEIGGLSGALAGMLSEATGAATIAARMRLSAAGRPIYPTGLADVHPAVVPVIERAAYVGGCEAVLTERGAELTGAEEAVQVGADLSLLLGEPEAWEAFDGATPENLPRVVTLGVLEDERSTALAAAEHLGDHLAGVRIEARFGGPGDLLHLVREVRWELDARRRSDVQIVVTGDLDEGTVASLARHVDGFGIGRGLARSSPARFSFEIVEVDGEARSHRGALSGRKTLWRCEVCGNRGIAPASAQDEPCPRCRGALGSLLVPRLRWGSPHEPAPDAGSIRARALKETAEAQHPF
jgi:nicotinate phosphoribosyltransferase